MVGRTKNPYSTNKKKSTSSSSSSSSGMDALRERSSKIGSDEDGMEALKKRSSSISRQTWDEHEKSHNTATETKERRTFTPAGKKENPRNIDTTPDYVKQFNADVANAIDQGSSQYVGDEWRKQQAVYSRLPEYQDTFSNREPLKTDYTPNYMDVAVSKLKEQMANTDVKPYGTESEQLPREARDELLNRYSQAASGLQSGEDWNAQSSAYINALYDTEKYGGVEKLLQEQQADAANDREYGRQLRGVDLSNMTVWDRLKGTAGGVLKGAGEQIGASGLGLVASGLNSSAMQADEEYGPALEQAAKMLYWGMYDDPTGDFSAQIDNVRKAAAYIGGDDYANRLINKIRASANAARENGTEIYMSNQLFEGLDKNEDALWENLQGTIKDTGIYDDIAKLQESSQKNIQYAKDVNLIQNKFGDNLVEAGVSTIQNTADAAMAAVLGLSGGAAMIPFALRAYGGSYAEALQQSGQLGETIGKDVAKKAKKYGLESSAVEVGTEMMWGIVGAMSKVTNGGALDDYTLNKVTDALSGLAKTEQGQKILTTIGEKVVGGITEGLEEVVGDIANYILNTSGIMTGAPREDLDSMLSETLHSFVTGALGGLMGEFNNVVAQPMRRAQIGKMLKAGNMITETGQKITTEDILNIANMPGMENTTLAQTVNDLYGGLMRNADSFSNEELGRLYEAYEETLGRSDTAMSRIMDAMDKVEDGQRLSNGDVNRITQNPDAVNYLQQNAGMTDLDYSGDITSRRTAVETALKALASQNTGLYDAMMQNDAEGTEAEQNARNAALETLMNRQAMPGEIASQYMADVFDKSARDALKERGVSDEAQAAIASTMAPGQDLNVAADEAASLYQRARSGEQFAEDVLENNKVSPMMASVAWDSGRSEYTKELNNGGEEGLRLREGLQGNGSQSTGGQSQGVVETPGSVELREGTAGFERSREVSGVYSKPVSAAELGIAGGSTNRNIRILTNSTNQHVLMAQKIIEAQGLKFVAFTGGALEINGEQARGYYDPTTNTVYVRADHRLFNADQIARHEAMHDKIRKSGNPKETLRRLRDEMIRRMGGAENFEKVMRNYMALYEGTGLDYERIFEEAVCDAAGNMNEFVYAGHWNDAKAAKSFYDVAREVSRQPMEAGEAATEEGRMSREVPPGAYLPQTAAEEKSMYEPNEAENMYGIDQDGKKFSLDSMRYDIQERKFQSDLINKLGWSPERVKQLVASLEGLMKIIEPDRDILDLNEDYTRENRPYSPYKPNSDPLYKISLDYSTLCRKRLMTQYIIEKLQLREHRPMSGEEQIAIRDMLKEYREQEKGLQVACAMCYVEAARLKSPDQMNRYFEDPEPILKNYFAQKNKAYKRKVENLQAQWKVDHGYKATDTKSAMTPADTAAFNEYSSQIRREYDPARDQADTKRRKEEQDAIARAKTLSVDNYLSAENLAKLKENDPLIYTAYTSHIRAATRSKGLETDVPYYYGDSRRKGGPTNKFIENVNKENGMRFSSWSDFQFTHLLDQIMATIDLSVRKAAMHGYTKFPEQVRIFGKTGAMFNMSGVSGGTGFNADGTLYFSPTESIDAEEAKRLRDEFPETAGFQCIGINEEHTRALLRSDFIDYVIPYHVSGLNATLRKMAGISDWKDYTAVQEERVIDPEDKRPGDKLWHKAPVFSEFFDKNWYQEYAGTGKGVEVMRMAADRYVEMCGERGLRPKFEEYLNEENYWKLLIDRKMVNQKTGDLIQQRPVTPDFDFDVIAKEVGDYVKGVKESYKDGKRTEDRALEYIEKNWDQLPARIETLKREGAVEKNIAESKSREARMREAERKANILGNEMYAAHPNDVGRASQDLGENYGALFEDLPDGRIRPKNVQDLSTEDWKLIYKTVNKLGYGLKSWQDAKEVYSRYAGKNGFNKEQSDAIRKAYGVVEGSENAANAKREALARKLFGTTGDFREAGYLMRNGSMLDFSGKKDGGPAHVRYMDHREISSAFADGEIPDEKTRYGDTSAYMNAFISEGNIRLMDGQGVTIGEMAPTAEQYRVLKQFIERTLKNEDYFYLDLSNNDGYTVASRDYSGSDTAERIIRDIKEYFKNGELPYRSDLSQFRYSRDLAPVFYSKLEREIERYKGDKIGAASAIQYLKGKGVKDEDIKWSGITTFLEGKKSVSKSELLDYLKDNQLQIQDNTIGDKMVYSNNYGEEFSPAELEEHINSRRDYIEKNHGKGNFKVSRTPQRIAIYINFGYGFTLDETINTNNMHHQSTKWNDYKTPGGKNYREILYKIPGSEYSNTAMNTHWGEPGVIAHARVQDFKTDDGKILFVEEIQSDWHNAGEKKGYVGDKDFQALKNEYDSLANEKTKIRRWINDQYPVIDAATERISRKVGREQYDVEDLLLGRTTLYQLAITRATANAIVRMLSEEETKVFDSVKDAYDRIEKLVNRRNEINRMITGSHGVVPDAPFRNGTYIQYVLKDLLRKAAEGDYDYLAWTTGEMQEDRWSDEYAEGYRIEYDQDIPSFLKKYGKQWGASLREIRIKEGESQFDNEWPVLAIPITDQMKESVLYEGQPKFSRELKSEAKRNAGEKLTEREFYSLYSAHKLDILHQGDIEAIIKNIREEGFKGYGGFGHNVLPSRQIVRYPTIDKYKWFLEKEKEGWYPEGYAEEYRRELGDEYGKPEPENIIVARYGPRKGEHILLVPRSGVETNKSVDRVKYGYKPKFDYEIVQADYDYQPYYEMYSKAYDESLETENTRFSRETNPDILERLNNQKTIKVYRAMQLIDGKLYPPMAAKVKDESGKRQLVEPTEMGIWYRSDERPDLIDKNGKFVLDKANGTTVPAAYNPYFHTSRSPLNDQFSSAYKRPNLVTVEVEIPESELTSGYRAKGAKDSVGEVQWHSGPVSSKLNGEKARKVILSRWVKVNRIIPDSEVADTIADILDGENISVPYNTVTPSLRTELEKRGVKIDDGKFSRDLSTSDLYEANRQLRKDLSEMRQLLKTRTAQKDYWKGQTKVTEGRRLRQDDVEKLTRAIIKNSDSYAKAETVGKKMKDLGEYLLNTEDDFDSLHEKSRMMAYEIAHDILDNSQVLNTRGGEDFYQDFRDYLRNHAIYVAPSVREELAPDGWNDFRKGLYGTMTLTADKTKGQTVDKAYQDLRSQFGDWLLPEIGSEADQLNRILEVVETYRPVYENQNSYDMADAVEWMANEVLTRIIGDEIRETNPTYADRMEKKLAQQKAKTQAALKRVREQRDRKVANIKQHYQETAEKNRNRKAESAERERLLHIARRLSNMKLPRVQRALLDQYIGDLDLVSKSITGRTVRDLRGLAARYMALKKERGEDFIADPYIEGKLERLGKKQISDLTQEEVLDLTMVLQNIETMLRTEQKLINSKVKEDTYLAGERVIDDIRNSNGKTGFLNRYISTETATPEREVHRVTGYNEDDPLYQVTKELSDGQRKMLDYQMRAEALFKKWTLDKTFIRKIAGKNAELIKIQGMVNGKMQEAKITPAMRMSLYLHEKNDENMTHIATGGVRIPDWDLYRKGKLQEAYDKGERVVLSRGMVKEIVSHMTPQEKAFADAASAYFNGMSRDEINDVSEETKGYALANVPFYFPINTDDAFLNKEFDTIKNDGSIEGMGFTKERKPSASNPVRLYDLTDVLNRSIQQHSKYVGLAIPVRNMNKLYRVMSKGYGTSVVEALKQNWGSDATKYIEKMMADIQSGTAHGGNVWGSLLAKARSRYAQAVLTMNISVAAKQTASYPTAAAVVGFGPLLKALKDVRKIDLDKFAEYTPLLWYRSKGFSNMELGDIGKEGKHIPKILNWIQGMDVATTTKLVKAAMIYVNENSNLTAYSDEWYKEVARIYNRIIEETQPNYTMMQRPQILRSEDSLVRALSMFKTQPFQNFNILYDAFGNLAAKTRQYKANGSQENLDALKSARKNAANAVGSQIASAFLFSLMQYIWDALRGKAGKYRDDDGEKDVLAWLKGMGINVLSSAGGMIPFGGYVLELGEALTDAVLKAFKADPFFDQTFYGITENAAESFNDMGNALIKVAKNAAGALEGGEITEKTIRSLISSATDMAQFAGAPVGNVRKLAQTIARNAFLAFDGEYVGGYEALRVTTDPSMYASDYYDLLYKAYRNDMDAYSEIREQMLKLDAFDEDKIDKAIRKREKERLDQSAVYQQQYDAMTSSSIWQMANDAQRDTATDNLMQIALQMAGIGTSTGESLQKKAEAGKSAGLDSTDYVLYKLALQVVDQPAGESGHGSYNKEEKEKAYRMLTGQSGENNPWK